MDPAPDSKTSLPCPELRRSRSERFLSIRQTTRALAAPLSAEDCAIQSMPDASPVKWHLAHTTWFFETFVLAPHQPGYRPSTPPIAFCSIPTTTPWATGTRDRSAECSRARARGGACVSRARRRGDARIARRGRLLPGRRRSDRARAASRAAASGAHPHGREAPALAQSAQARIPEAMAAHRRFAHARRRWISFEAGLREIGHAGAGFCFDNETPRHRVWLDAFEIASHPVTHGDFLEFIDDGGYRRPELWLSAGWDAVSAARLAGAAVLGAPRRRLAYVHAARAWRPSIPHTPVCHVSFYEADAFARWANARLPTEAEWEVAARDAPLAGNFLESGALHPLALREARGRWNARAGLRRRLGVDAQRLRALPRLSGRRRRARRVQRQVHVRPVRAARRLVRHAGQPHPRDLSQLLSARRALAVLGPAPRARSRMTFRSLS